MRRKTANGRYTSEFKDHVLSWVMAEDGRNASRASDHFSVGHTAIRQWMKRAGVKTKSVGPFSPQTSKAKAPAPPTPRANPQTGGRFRAPVADLERPDRDRAVRTVRNLAEIVDIAAQTTLDRLKRAVHREGQLDSGRVHLDEEEMDYEREKVSQLLRLSRDDASAMLHLTKTQGLLIDHHPGVLELAGVTEQNKRGARNLERVAAALGVPPTKP